jgi:hypothetical protein
MSYNIARIFPIPQETLRFECELFGDHTWQELRNFEELNRDIPGIGAIYPYLAGYQARPSLNSEGEDERHRSAYQAGILIGLVLLRDRFTQLSKRGGLPVLSAEELPSIQWDAAQAKRFPLSQFIESGDDFDPRAMVNHLETAWDMQAYMASMAGAGDLPPAPNVPEDDWVTIGMGDLLASYASLLGGASLVTVDIASETMA